MPAALPELFSCGYVPNRGVWAAAEARGGRADRWLAARARRLGLYLGAGAAETDGTDFFNVFTLAAPEGVLTADVVMDLARKHCDAQPSFGGRLQPGPWAGRHVIIPLDIAVGRPSYTISRQRRQKTRDAAERASDSAGTAVWPRARPATHDGRRA